MTPEILVLTLGALLTIAQFVLMAVPANIQLGPRYTTGPRDKPAELHGKAGRLHRALNNMFEAMVLYTAAAVAVSRTGAAAFTAACAWVWLAARVIYIPLYAYGIGPWRSYVWAVGLLATTLMLIAALL